MWIALDESTLDNGCMWYGAGTHAQPLRAHRKAGPADNAPLECDATEAEMTPMPLQPGALRHVHGRVGGGGGSSLRARHQRLARTAHWM